MKKREQVIFDDANLALLWLMANPKGYLKRVVNVGFEDIIRNYDGNSKLEVEKWSDFPRIGGYFCEREIISYEDFVHDYSKERFIGKAVI